MRRRRGFNHWMEVFSSTASRWTGSTPAFACAVGVVAVWAVTGPIFGFSDTWQLVINTGTTIVTFLMVFLIQRAQNKDALALQLKLNELVAAMEGASNRLIDVEDLTEDELRALHKYYAELVKLARKDGVFTKSHSVEEAERSHARKRRSRESKS
jgi:low affinity Fe/Cu permease